MDAPQLDRIECLSEVDKALLGHLILAANNQQMDAFCQLLVKLIDKIDELLSAQLAEVIEHPKFQAMESRWQGLYSLALLPENSRYIKTKVLDFSWQDISEDLNHCLDLKQTQLYRKTYSEELDTAGGEPYGLLVVDHYLMGGQDFYSPFDDIYTTQLLGEVGQLALCPVVLGVDENFLGDDPGRTYHDHRRLDRILDSEELSAWHRLREHPASRFVCAALPRARIRDPWRGVCAGFQFNQPDTEKGVLWGNSAFLVANNVIREFNRISWFGFLRAMDAEGDATSALVIENQIYQQPIRPFVDIFSEHDAIWSQAGFMPLTTLYLSDQVGFFSNQSAWRPHSHADRSIGMLQTTLMACRFGHYLKAQIRDKNGSYLSAEDCRKQIDQWFQQYVSEVEYADDSIMARYPLRGVDVMFSEHPADETRYYCEITLQPQYQYEQLEAQVVLRTELNAYDLGELR